MQHLSLKDVAFESIRKKIINGELAPGSRIREDHLAEELSMSRTPVREAVHELIAGGLVVNVPRKGLYLVEPSMEDMENYIDIRKSLESLSIAKCVSRIKEDQLNELSQLLEEFESAITKGKFEVCNKLDNDFHFAIAAISGNTKLLEIFNDLAGFLSLARSIEKKTHPLEKNKKTLDEHRKILEAIRIKDVKLAEAAMANNIETMRLNLDASAS